MKCLPFNVARMIYFDKVHPVKAWRLHYKISREMLARHLNLSADYIAKMETSNLHLQEDNFNKIVDFFKIEPMAVKIRHLA